MAFTRQLDDENADSGELSAIVERFTTALRVLFLEGRCVDLAGFTRHMLSQLQKPRSFQPAPTQPARTFGGPGAISDDVVERCLARMRKYARLAAEVTRAEFPPISTYWWRIVSFIWKSRSCARAAASLRLRG